MADDESRGVHLTDKQLVFVFMAATVIAVVVFLFGVLVGRGVQRARGPIADAELAGAADVVPDGAAEEPPAAVGASRSGSSGAGPADLSYAEPLGKTQPGERLKPAPPSADGTPAVTAPPDVPGEPVAPVPASATPAPAPPAEPAAVRYTVQVEAVRQREEADAIVKRLKAKGYDAYVFVPKDGDSLGVFRVRIGSFRDKRQADLLAERLLREEKRYKPWVTR
jgi:cell division septation protein DedD